MDENKKCQLSDIAVTLNNGQGYEQVKLNE